jgi:hypothetical protein
MDGLIELIFERVPDGAVDKLVNDLLQGVGILELSHSELGSLDPKKAGQDLMPLLKQEAEPSSIFVRAAIATIGDVPIRSPLVRILRFEGSNEVAVVFGSADVDATDRQDVVTKLAAGAKVLASSADVPEYYCGFEPATDEKTRLFSWDKIGPLVTV